MSISYDICLAHTYLLSVQIHIYIFLFMKKLKFFLKEFQYMAICVSEIKPDPCQ